MYILIKEEYVTAEEVRARYHKSLPDGRIIITPQELKMLGSVPECQIVATKVEVDAIIDEQVSQGVQPMESLQPAVPATPDEDVTDEPTDIDDAGSGETGTDGPTGTDDTVDMGDSEDTDNTSSETADGTEEDAVADGTENGDGEEWERLKSRKATVAG